jgi:predicted GNAT family N-acyltransferase
VTDEYPHRVAPKDQSFLIRQADYESDELRLRAVRFEVFVDEQRVPPEIEMDERDRQCVHFLAFEGQRAVGTARIDLERGGKIGRLAVLAAWRRRGIGRALMEACHSLAAQRGVDTVWCHAQVAAESFYRGLGYRAVGPVFDEAGIAHREMRKRLDPPA